MKKYFLVMIALVFLGHLCTAQQSISLKGEWIVKLDTSDAGVREKWFKSKFSGTGIQLPGTLDDAGIGTPLDTSNPAISKDLLYKLTRKNSYIGPAWYYKEIVIPAHWKEKQIQLNLERVLWGADVWIDGNYAGSAESLSTPQVFDVSAFLTPGRHFIVIKVDNRKRHEISVRNLAHAYTEGTQIIWNGMIGDLNITAKDKIYIYEVQTYANFNQKSIKFSVAVNNALDRVINSEVQIDIIHKNKKITSRRVKLVLKPGENKLNEEVSLGSNALEWNEFTPNIYVASVKVKAVSATYKDSYSTAFALREVRSQEKKIFVNNLPVFLRGTLECNIFPLNGYPPMNRKGWEKVFSVAKNYGLNHLRFHSWCPPKAAFEVADSMGFYLQVELPFWATNLGKDSATLSFIEDEAIRISKRYGNHPSFLLWSLGNELQGDFIWLQSLLKKLKAFDSRHLYTTTTFTFQKDRGRWPEADDDFFITQYTKNGWVRGQGIFNTMPPDFSADYNNAVDSLPIPLITHEIGQYSVYPNLREIKKYTGVLEPFNLKIIEKDLREKGMIELSDSFTMASGRFAANLYKEEIERSLKTNGISGFQLLDLHDFPGQGTAHVGVLDAFWDSKGLVTSEQHRMYCSPLVPLLRFSKATYTNKEKFLAKVEIANYGNDILQNTPVIWTIKNNKGQTLIDGKLSVSTINIGLNQAVGNIEIDLQNFKQAEQLIVEVALKNTIYKNNWKIWVYPSDSPKLEKNSVLLTRSVEEAINALGKGRNVLLNPDTANTMGVEGRFAPVFWSPLFFPNQPGTMGILCNPAHPALKHFPTDFYSDWQWWQPIHSSKTLIIDNMPQLRPIVRVIDNFQKNRKMANVIEAKYGKGKLVLCSINISDSLDSRPAAKQLRYSLLKYMNSEKFSPANEISIAQLKSLIK